MLSAQEEMWKLRKEVRLLRIKTGQQEYLLSKKKKQIDELNDLLKERDALVGKLESQRDELNRMIEELKRQKDVYRGMVYKPNVKEKTSATTHGEKKRDPGGQKGHSGHARTKSQAINSEKRVWSVCCPECKGELSRVAATTEHIVEDIPSPETITPIVTKYVVERQWCKTCKKEVRGKAVGVIPGSRFGPNLIVQLLIWKYRCRIPFVTMVGLFQTTYGITVSEGCLIDMVHRTREWLGNFYDDLLQEIRGSPVKHADETGWRIAGINSWVWAFLTKTTAYYTIEETRGKGIPQKILKGSQETDVLVRDDYAGYDKIPMLHQSCWAHLLRKSHEAVVQPKASDEMKKLHETVKTVYQTLLLVTGKTGNLKERERVWRDLLGTINTIIVTIFESDDAKKIQTRITNQGKNLLTALLHEGVPLTNNLAERTIRPMVVTRKVSGGSRSKEGAQTHAVNMSIVQTITMRNQPLPKALYGLLLTGSAGKR